MKKQFADTKKLLFVNILVSQVSRSIYIIVNIDQIQHS